MWYESTAFQIWYSNHVKNEHWFDNTLRFCDGSKKRFIETTIKNMNKKERDSVLESYHIFNNKLTNQY